MVMNKLSKVYKTILVTLTLLLSLAVTSEIQAQENQKSEVKSETVARRQFLMNLGFEDVSSIIKGKLDKGEYEHELNRRQMIANAKSYEVLNAVRELSILIYQEMGVLSESKIEQLAKFSAKMLALKPLSPATDYPTDILEMPAGEAKNDALVRWLDQERRKQMESQTRKVLSDIVTLALNGEVDKNAAKIDRMYKLVSTIVDRMYLDDLIGNSRYFGRAMTALLLREEKLSGRTDISKKINRELKEHNNLFLENFFGDTMLLPTQKGLQKVKIENGTMMLTRNLSSESLTTSIAAIPGHLGDRWRARFSGLVGNPLAAPFFVTPEDTKNGMNLWLRIRDRIAQSNLPIQTGLSHIVYYQIKEDKETGIKMPRVIDNFPNRIFDISGEYARTGGTRFVFPEQVIDLSKHSAVYFSTPDPERVQRWAQENLKTNGYQAEFFPSVEMELSAEGPVKNSRAKNWKTGISEQEFTELYKEQNANKLSKTLWDRYVKGLEQTVYEGWIFHWPDPYDFYLISATYCSQLADMVMRKVNGISIEQHKSAWHWGLRFLAHIGNLGTTLKGVKGLEAVGDKLLNLPDVKKAMKLTKIPIIAPSNIVIQPYMEGVLHRLESKSPEQRVQSSYQIGEYRETNHRLTQKLNEVLPIEIFDIKKTDVISSFGAGIRDFQYGMVMRASQGIKTKNFSTDDMAHIAAEKGLKKVNAEWEYRGKPDSLNKSCKPYFK